MNEDPRIPGPWAHGQATVNRIRLHHVEDGAGPLVLLSHSFPEFGCAWRNPLPALAEAGYHAAAADRRGYNASDKRRGVAS